MKFTSMPIFLLLVTLSFSLLSLSGCSEINYLIDRITHSPEIDDEGDERVTKAMDEAISEAEIQIQEEELLEGFNDYPEEEKTGNTEEAGPEEGTEEEERYLPDEPVTYDGEFEGVNIRLVINFRTADVSGTVVQSGDVYIDAVITGTINKETFYLKATCSGVIGAKSYEKEEPFNGIITGTVTEDLGAFIGEILDDEGNGGEFAAYSKYQ